MIANLQRFYGGDPGAWMRLPLRTLRAYMDQLPVLRARDALSLSAIIGVGTGSFKANDSAAIRREWQRAAGHRQAVIKPATQEELMELLGSSGISVG